MQRCRRMLDLDADPDTVEAHFADDTCLLRSSASGPGLRSPGHPDGAELLTRAVLGQQVSVKGARTLAARLVAADRRAAERARRRRDPRVPVGCGDRRLHARRLRDADGPRPGPDPRLRATRRRRIVIDAGSDRDEIARQLESLPGIGPWTAELRGDARPG